MTQENNIQELDQMKQQLEMLKKKLETQNIINEKIIRSAMKSKLGNINRMGRFFFILGILVAIWAPGFFAYMGCSMWFCGGTFVMLLFCALKTLQYHRELWRLDINSSNILETGKKVARLRNRYKDWKRIAYPMIAVWLIWTCIEIYLIYGHDAIWFCSGGIFGGLIGGICGTRMNNKVIHTADELLGQIKDYETEL